MAKVSKNQRTGRIHGDKGRDMARLVLAEKNSKGHYSFRQKMVDVNDVQEELKAAKERR